VETVYVARADGSGGRSHVSLRSGRTPVWTRTDREIAYRSGEAFLAAPFDPVTGDVGSPVEVFRMPVTGSLWSGRVRDFDVSPDGNRLLVTVPVAKADDASLVVVLGWRSEVERRMGSRE
jgi:hypothetical protein